MNGEIIGLSGDAGYVYLIDGSFGEEGDVRHLNDEDDDEPPIEGCTSEDVGAIMLDARAAGPRWFTLRRTRVGQPVQTYVRACGLDTCDCVEM